MTAEPASTGTVTLASDGTVPASPSGVALASGSYSYAADYAGDGNDGSKSGSCEPFAVAGLSGPAIVTVPTVVVTAPENGARYRLHARTRHRALQLPGPGRGQVLHRHDARWRRDQHGQAWPTRIHGGGRRRKRSPDDRHDPLYRASLQLPGSGEFNVLGTAWSDNLPKVARVHLLGPARRRFVFARASRRTAR